LRGKGPRKGRDLLRSRRKEDPVVDSALDRNEKKEGEGRKRNVIVKFHIGGREDQKVRGKRKEGSSGRHHVNAKAKRVGSFGFLKAEKRR